MAGTRVAVIGGGIGGLATAAALQRTDADVTIYERSSQLSEIGAGIQLTPNAVRVLNALGCGDGLEEFGFRPESITGLDWRTGKLLFRKPLIEVCRERYGADYFHIHRADLHRVLLRRVEGTPVRLGAACTGLDTGGAGPATVTLADGSKVEADAVIGADGIHSMVRQAVIGAQPARFTGHVCWRTTIPVDKPRPELAEPRTTIWLGPKGHVVTYYVHAGTAINLIAIIEADEWTEESWTAPSSREAMIATFAGWHPKMLTLFQMATDVFKWGLFDRDPLPRWTKGRTTLLGDAAHPMLPYLSQGAGMAIEDAFVLARALEAHADAAAALAAYETVRRPRTSQVQLASRAQGESFHLTSPWARLRRNLRFAVRSLTSRDKGFETDWLYAHDVTQQARPALQAAA
ncbi:MAG: FAD-dependent monooxygenase [Proteobacteria bacterium]|nr:FAD-dependent monooxygenase [Pseudomonadota bacterium]